MIRTTLRSGLLTGLLLLSGQVAAAPILHNTKTSFDNAVGAGLLTENFDDEAITGAFPVAINNSDLNQVSSTASSIAGIQSFAGGRSLVAQDGSGSWDMTFSFGQAIDAFGILLFDLFENQPGSLTFATSNGGGTLETGTLVNNQQFANNASIYVGLTGALSFTEITLSASNLTFNDGGHLDDVGYNLAQTVTVPVPASAGLMALGLLGMRRLRGLNR